VKQYFVELTFSLSLPLGSRASHLFVVYVSPGVILAQNGHNITRILTQRCGYANILPHRVVYRLWDCLLWEGNISLMRAAVALIHSKQERIFECDDFMSIYMVLKDISVRVSDLIPYDSALARDLGTVDDSTQSVSFDSSSSPPKKTMISMISKGFVDHESGNRGISNELAFIKLSFDKKYCGSYPRSKINAFRRDMRHVLEEGDRKNAEREREIMGRRKSAKFPSSDFGGSSVAASEGAQMLESDEAHLQRQLSSDLHMKFPCFTLFSPPPQRGGSSGRGRVGIDLSTRCAG
jgi:hypothetical protein